MADDFAELKFPDELYGVIIEDIDVTILCSDSVRLIDAYGKQGGELSDIQQQVLRQCDEEFKIVIPKVEGQDRKYLEKIHKSVKDIISKYIH